MSVLQPTDETAPGDLSHLADDHSDLVRAQRSADIRARTLRSEWTSKYASTFLSDYIDERAAAIVAASPFADYAQTYRHERPLLVLAFNLAVTHQVVVELCKSEEDPVALIATVSRAVELGLHSLHDPLDPTKKPDLFLAPAKQRGYFFTPPDVAFDLARSALGDRTRVERVLDPAAGAGALLAAVLVEASNGGVELGSVHAIELDPFASNCCRILLDRVSSIVDVDCAVSVDTGDAIKRLYAEAQDEEALRYDCIVMNPPYGRVKFLRGILTNAETRVEASADELDALDAAGKAEAKTQAKRFRKMSATLGIGAGGQDYQRLFKALGISVLSPEGRFALISSDAWLGDSQTEDLRRMIIRERLLERVTLYPETSGLFATVNQPTAVAVLSRSPKEDLEVRLVAGREREEVDRYTVSYGEIEELDPKRLRLPRVPRQLHDVYVKLAAAPRIKDLPWVRNVRGELDQTMGRDLIQTEPSELRLVRGDHVERYCLSDAGASSRPGYVDVAGFEARFSGSPKFADVRRWRLAGRQCSYQNKPRRLSFALVPPQCVVGNSCNYLTVLDETEGQPSRRLSALLLVMNSAIAEFFFRLFNANNHVANYEIDELPVPNSDLAWEVLEKQAEFLMTAYSAGSDAPKMATALEDIADGCLAYSFGLTGPEIEALMEAVDPRRAKRVASVTEFLSTEGYAPALTAGSGWFQHITPTLSALDRQIIEYVPQGGNWQDIPESVPSERLVQIREMTAWRGVVRTTYYGRLRPDQPAYTVATYYNRPGNGTNIHPWEDRTLTSREAARLQAFPDWYVFAGSEGAIRKQVGNAVPPLLAAALGIHFRNAGFNGPWIDLFCGAGGLSLGLEQAGLEVAAAADNDRDALRTYRLNRPCEGAPDPASTRTLLLGGDLSDPAGEREALDEMAQKLGGRSLSALVGGPPCQGFSQAGWRSATDDRNNLASAFMRMVGELRPELVVLENVEGLLTYEKGRVMRELVVTLRELGYAVPDTPWLLRAEMYGVPQMRRRVFLVANLRGSILTPPPALMQACKGRREARGQDDLIAEAPYPTTVAEALSGLPALAPISHPSLGGRPLRPLYSEWLRGERSTQDFFEKITSL